MRVGSILISFAALALLVAAFGAKFYSAPLSSVLLMVVLVALCAAIVLHVRFLILVRREHRDTASALDTTEREFQSIFANAIDGILILDDRGICQEANPAAQTLFGARYHELVGEPIGKFHAGGGDIDGTWKAFLERKYEHGETRLRREDGNTILVEYTAKADYLPGRHVAVLRDITRRKQAEAALRESEERFQQMAANIQEIFWMLDADTKKVIYVNRAYQTITGRSCESLRDDSTSYDDLIHPEDRVRVLSRLNEAVRSGQFDEEFRIRRSDEAIRWVWARGFPCARRLWGCSESGRNGPGHLRAKIRRRTNGQESRYGGIRLGGSGRVSQDDACSHREPEYALRSRHPPEISPHTGPLRVGADTAS